MTGWTLSHAAYDAAGLPAFASGCPGTFEVIEDDGKEPAWLECSGCQKIITVAQSLMVEPVAEPLREGWGF